MQLVASKLVALDSVRGGELPRQREGPALPGFILDAGAHFAQGSEERGPLPYLDAAARSQPTASYQNWRRTADPSTGTVTDATKIMPNSAVAGHRLYKSKMLGSKAELGIRLPGCN